MDADTTTLSDGINMIALSIYPNIPRHMSGMQHPQGKINMKSQGVNGDCHSANHYDKIDLL